LLEANGFDKFCKIAPLLTIAPGEIIPDYTVIYGPYERRRQKRGMESLKDAGHAKHIEMLRGLIPNNVAAWQ
jgi:dynactin-6